MRKLWASVKKEAILLWRDKAGLSILFVMPVTLILIMTLLQDSSFKMLQEKRIPLLIVNADSGSFGRSIVHGLDSTRFFKVHQILNGQFLTDSGLISQVAKGNYQVGIIISKNATMAVKNNLRKNVSALFPEEYRTFFNDETYISDSAQAKIEVFFDPATKASFKQTVLMALRQYAAMAEFRLHFAIYNRLLSHILSVDMTKKSKRIPAVVFTEQYASTLPNKAIPNSVQHNVPAWTLFALFFLVIPLAGNLINERNRGINNRLATMPHALFLSDFGKMGLYFMIGILQALLMLGIGIFILPLFGLPALHPHNHYGALFLLIAVSSMAAASYGLALGTFFSSQEQSSIFGAISVVILAAIGGIWVPVFMMSDVMRTVSHFSPLNWGLNGFNELFLRNAGLSDIAREIMMLFAFSLCCLAMALAKACYRKRHT